MTETKEEIKEKHDKWQRNRNVRMIFHSNIMLLVVGSLDLNEQYERQKQWDN